MGERHTRVRANQIRSIFPNDIEATNSPSDTYIIKYDLATGKFTWIAQTSGTNVELEKSITQSTHGFSVGDVLRYNGTIYTEAQADTSGNAEVIGIVSVVTDADNFILHVSGYIDGLSGLTAGSVYFLSDATAGLLTTTEPTTIGSISKPVLIAASTTTGYFYNFRGTEIPAVATYNTLDAAYDEGGAGAGRTINVDSGAVLLTGSVNDILEIDNDGTQHGIYLHQDGVLAASKYGLYIYSNAIQNDGILARFHQDNASSVGDVLSILNDGKGDAIYIDQNGVLGSGDSALYIYSNAVQTNSDLITFHLDNASSTENLLRMQNDGSGIGLYVIQNAVLAVSKYGAWFYSNLAQTNSSLVFIEQDHASSTANVLDIQNDGSGKCLYIQQVGVLTVGKHGLHVYSNAVQVNDALVKFRLDNSGSTRSVCEIFNDGTGNGLYIYPTGNSTGVHINHVGTGTCLYLTATGTGGNHIRFLSDPTNTSPNDGDFWFDGADLKLRVGITTYTINKT